MIKIRKNIEQYVFVMTVIAFAGFMYGFLFQAYAPILPFLINTFSLTDQAAGTVIGIFAMASVLVSIPVGLLGDRYSAKLLLLCAALLIGIGCLINALMQSYTSLLVGRFISGLGAAVIMTLVPKYLALTMPKERLDYAVSLYNQLLTAGFAIGVLIAQASYALAGLKGLQWLLVVCSVVLLIGFYQLPKTAKSEEKSTFAWPNTAAWLITAAFFLHGMGNMQLLTFMPMDLGQLQQSKSFIAWVIAAFYIPSTLFTIWLCRPLKTIGQQKYMVMGCQFIIAVVVAVLCYFTDAPNAYLVVAIIVGMSLVGVVPVLYLLTNLLVPQSQFGLVFGLYTTAFTAGVFVGGQIIGYLRDHYTVQLGYLFIAVMAISISAIMFIIPKRQLS